MRIEKDQIISGIVLIVMAAVFVFGAWMPMRGKKSALLGRIEQLNQQLGPQRAEVANLVGLVRGWDLRRIATFATAVSAIHCTVLGNRKGIPSMEEVDAFVRERT